MLGGDQGFDVAGVLANVRSNPLAYGLAFSGAVIWAAYCAVTARMAKGGNGVTLFFALTAATSWVQYALHEQPPMNVTPQSVVLLVLAAAAMAFGYAAWNFGILHGNVTVLGASLSLAFWQGACMVVGGSLLCWFATRARR